MPRVKLAQTSFTGGELSPRVMGHTDVDRYASGLKKALNFHPVIQGGLKRRAGTRYGLPATAVGLANESILIPFVQGRDQAWLLEVSDGLTRVIRNDGVSIGVNLATPYSVATLRDLDWAQSDSTLYLFHPLWPIHVIQHLPSDHWVLTPANFTQTPFAEVGISGSVDLTLSAATVGSGRTLTDGGVNNTFMAADVGRAIISKTGIAVITAVAGPGSATVTINRAFLSTSLLAADWRMEGSPQATLTPSGTGPIGTSITLTLSPAAGWRNADVGSVIRINAGLVRIKSVDSTIVVTATVLQELAGTTAAPALSWTLEPSVWSTAHGYPRTGTVHQQRLICAGNKTFPRTVWGSRIAEPLDFELGTTDDAAFAFTIDSDESSPIAYVTSTKGIAVFTESGEYSMRGGVEKPITPTNVRIEPESAHGVAKVRPCSINRETMFVQRAGRKVRAYGYRYDFDGFSSVDVSALAEHLTRAGVVSLAYQQEPDQIMWAVLGDGKFLSCTIDRDQQPSVIGWAMHETDGAVECVASIPNGNADQLWLIVRREIDGEVKRSIEWLDEFFEPIHPSVSTDGPVYGATVDCAKVFDNPAGQSTFAIPHLSGKWVDVVADGSKLVRRQVATDGTLTIERSSKRTLIGLPFTSRATLLTPEFNAGDGTAQGQATRTGQMHMRFLDTVGGKVTNIGGQSQEIPMRRFGVGILDNAPDPFTGMLRVTVLGWDRGEGDLSIVQEDPYPMHLLSVVRVHTVNG